MKERPILFSAPMVRAILASTKTQTRRVLKQATGPSLSVGIDDAAPGVAELSWLWGDGPGHDVHETIKRVPCPYGQPGDRLWVRETHSPQPDCWGSWDRWMRGEGGPGPVIHYKATDPKAWVDRWRPSIHMPRWASRITLEITGVRVERLQDISEADSQAEGVEWLDHPPACAANDPARGWRGYMNHEPLYRDTARDSFASLWSSINGAESWEANPWVWCVEFKKLED